MHGALHRRLGWLAVGLTELDAAVQPVGIGLEELLGQSGARQATRQALGKNDGGGGRRGGGCALNGRN